ncbi:polysaccharide biosynthesis protein, partial [Alphaproteobacteria bacterium]|nr:polysaccharide biosynthesis protein [Alphaproteobacteria bacterium]
MFKKNTHLLITGGTGSFGKAMVRKVINNENISVITILSRDEKKQEDLRNEFKSKKLNFILCDIRDRENVFSSFNEVDFIFHAAALKQVPNCEFFPMEAVKTNILGAANVIDAAIYNNVKKIVVLSTDKAAYPINTMGCTKMLMEKIMISKSSQKSNGSSTIVCGIRYGNVLFSRGSVVPLFLRQINENKPLTITNPNMTRFLIPLSEATDLVLY